MNVRSSGKVLGQARLHRAVGIMAMVWCSRAVGAARLAVVPILGAGVALGSRCAPGLGHFPIQ